MKRRHLVVIVSAISLLTLAFIAMVTVGVGIGTQQGRDQIRSIIQLQIGSQIRGKVHLGQVTGNVITGFSIDSIAIRDDQDSLFLSSGRITVDYDPRDVLDRRLLLRNLRLEHPFIQLRQYPEGDWNFQRLFRKGGPSAPNAPGQSFGDFVVLEDVRVRDGTVLVTRPWRPNDTLSAAGKDSSIRYHLARRDREIRRAGTGFQHTLRWSKITGELPRLRIADPDSARFGALAVFRNTSMEELEPPFSFRNGSGVIRKLGDSIFLDVNHFDLPASTGSARGKIWWGNRLPTRMDIFIRGDSVALNDVAWIYPTLPRTGGGRTDLRITRDPKNLNDYKFALTNLDAKSTRSRLTGAMTFITGRPVLQVMDVDLVGAPINFDLVRTLAGEPLPVDWQGDLWGYAKGPGGPLTNFVIDESDVTFRDAHVAGAVTKARGRGELDILDPEFTKFHGFEVNAEVVDLRSIEYLFPAFPRIHGTVAGSVVLDSIWTDVRFRNANVVHRNLPTGEPSRVTGSGRITYGIPFMKFDVNVTAQPLSVTMMSHAYELGLKGLMSGPIQAKGTSDEMQVTARLEGPAGKFFYTGRADAYPLSVMARGTGRYEQLDLSQLVELPNVPKGWMTGTYQIDVRYDTTDMGTLVGSAATQIERAEIDSNRIFASRFRARFSDRRMYLDTLRVESVAATLTAAGTLGLAERTDDSLQYQVVVDSLGGLRRYIEQAMSAFERPAGATADSLGGTIAVTGTARGSLRFLDMAGRIDGSNLFIRREAGNQLAGSFDLKDVVANPSGALDLQVKRLNVGVIALDTLGVSARFESAQKGAFTLGALAKNKVTFSAGGDIGLVDAQTNVLLKDLSFVTDSSRWGLRAPARIAIDGPALGIDSLHVTNARGGSIVVEGFVSDTGKGRMLVKADSVSLYEIGQIAQIPKRMSGWAYMTLQGGGTSSAPVMNIESRLSHVLYGDMQLSRVNALARYADRKAEVAVDLARGGRPVVIARATLPVELKYFGAQTIDDTLRGSIRTDSANVDLLQVFLPLSQGSGRLEAHLDLGGTWSHPDLSGPIRIENGEATADSLGIRLRGINVDLALHGHSDSLHINKLTAWSGQSPADVLSVSGYIAYRNLKEPYLDLLLRARTFRAFDKRSLARIDFSTSGLRLRGSTNPTLTGNVVVDRGTIYLPDPALARKQLADFSIADTANVTDVGMATSTPLLNGVLSDGLSVTLGDEVYLRSNEANIKLAGSLNVLIEKPQRFGQDTSRQVDDTAAVYLDGTLRAERGTYSLALDPTGYFLRREFQVEGGTITFYGASGLDPELNISALHTVRTANGEDIRIRVRLTGPIYPNPIVTLESAESFQLGQSDLVSYLLFGQPSSELGAGQQRLIEQGLRTINLAENIVSQSFSGILGWAGLSDLGLRLTPPADLGVILAGNNDFTRNRFSEAIRTTRFGAERQIREKIYVSVSAPVCAFTPEGTDESAFTGLSGKLEFRFNANSSIRAGKEPSALACGRTASRVVPTPSQWGVAFFKSWRF
jgi:translocation and assembly module TamB